MDEPQSNPSSVPLYFLAKLAREHVTVVLSAKGQMKFCRVRVVCRHPAMQKFKKLPRALRRAAAAAAKPLPYFKGKNFLMKCAEKPEDSFLGQALVFPEKEAAALVKPPTAAAKSRTTWPPNFTRA